MAEAKVAQPGFLTPTGEQNPDDLLFFAIGKHNFSVEIEATKDKFTVYFTSQQFLTQKSVDLLCIFLCFLFIVSEFVLNVRFECNPNRNEKAQLISAKKTINTHTHAHTQKGFDY